MKGKEQDKGFWWKLGEVLLYIIGLFAGGDVMMYYEREDKDE